MAGIVIEAEIVTEIEIWIAADASATIEAVVVAWVLFPEGKNFVMALSPMDLMVLADLPDLNVQTVPEIAFRHSSNIIYKKGDFA